MHRLRREGPLFREDGAGDTIEGMQMKTIPVKDRIKGRVGSIH